MAPMRNTVRRRALARVRAANEPKAAKVIYGMLQKRFKTLKRELRQANLRKRLAKNLRDTGQLFKDNGDEDWQEWIDSFSEGIEDALTPMVVESWMTETKYWNSRNFWPDPVDASNIFDSYEARTGRQIKDIGAETQTAVLTTVSSWYGTDAGFPELIDSLGQFFSEQRAERIARTESTYITSEVSTAMYDQFGIEFFNVDLGDAPCEECEAEATNNPHSMDDDMPPYHPNCQCGTTAADEAGKEFTFGSDIDVNDPNLGADIEFGD